MRVKKLINVSLYLLSCIPRCLRKRNLGKLDNSVLPDRVRVYDGGDDESADKKTMKTTRNNFDYLQFNCITFVLLNKVNSIVIIFKCNHDRIDGDKGRVLYAPPALLAEHLVFLSNEFNKGGTISFTHLYSKTLITKSLPYWDFFNI